MIYSLKSIQAEINRYFSNEVQGDNTDIICSTNKMVKSILNTEDIICACQMVRDNFINLKINNILVYPDKKHLPVWIRQLVYTVIYNYLSGSDTPKYNQGQLLKEMGLYADIFGKKHWNMYSPDMKVRQSRYETLELPFNHAEIESDKIFRAMIHYIVCYSAVLTEYFVDVFGKLGLIPALCAKGYTYSQSWVNSDFNVVVVFQYALKKRKKVCKYLKKVQYNIKHDPDEDKIIMRYIGTAVANELELRSWDAQNLLLEMNKSQNPYCKQQSSVQDTQQSSGVLNQNCNKEWHLTFNIYRFAAYFIVQQYFLPEYWIDTNLKKIKTKNSRVQLSEELEINLSKKRIENFVNYDYDEIIIKLSDAYKAKRFSFQNINAEETILKLFKQWCIKHEIIEDMDLLYLDVPKYMREEKRFQFDLGLYYKLFKILSVYKGDWILTWKNYVEVSKKRLSNSLYAAMYSENKIQPLAEYYDDIDVPEKIQENSINKLYYELEQLSKKRQLYIFRYRDEDRNHSNSIMFITTIDFPLPDSKAFQKKYNVDFVKNGKLEKIVFEDFYSDFKKWLDTDLR